MPKSNGSVVRLCYTPKHTIALPCISIITTLPSKELISHPSIKGWPQPAHSLQHKVVMAVVVISPLPVLAQLSIMTITPVHSVRTIIHVIHCVWVTPLATTVTTYSP